MLSCEGYRVVEEEIYTTAESPAALLGSALLP
jgi:hypothetical protein